MKQVITFTVLLVFFSFATFAQKDIDAWKSEPNIEQQFEVFKENVNFWDGKYFMTPPQLNEFFNALNDSVSNLEREIANLTSTINDLEAVLDSTNQRMSDAQAELDTSIEMRNTIDFMGMDVNKNVFTLIMSIIILSLLVLLGLIFVLFKRSNRITVQTKRDYEELKQEFETHKKSALDRYTKINTELHHARMKLKNQ